MLLLSIIVFVVSSPQTVFGQSGTLVLVEPDSRTVTKNQIFVIQINIENGISVSGFDIQLTYDPAILSFQSHSAGTYLSNLYTVVKRIEPGFVQLVMVQIARPEVNGDGTLLTLTFEGISNGISLIQLNHVELADSQGATAFPIVANGSILVHSDPASVPTRTVTGSFSLQGQSNASGIPVEFGYGQTHWLGPYSGLTTSGTPNLSLPNVAEDTYPVTISLPRYLNVHEGLSKGFIVSSTSTVMPPLMLYGGNAVWRTWVDGAWQPDNIINAADVSLVGAQYLQSGPDLDGDVNYSGRVDIFDLAMVGANYGLTSKDVYATWLSVH